MTTIDERFREAVAQALREADPLRLLASGAPPDEYDPEVSTVVPRLCEAASAADVRTILHTEFVRWFDARIAGAPELYEEAARRIWAVLHPEQAR